jgi:septal ring factor EnvC (AmiA/AmiB activator)
MLNNELYSKNPERPSDPPKGLTGMFAALIAGLVLALAGNVFLLIRSNQASEDMARMQNGTQAQISKISDATTSLLEQRLQTLNEEMKQAQDSATTALKRARSETQKQAKDLSRKLEEQQKEVADQIAQLRDAATTADTKISEVSTDVNGVKTDVNGVKTDVSSVKTDVSSVKADVASAQSGLDKATSDLKRVMGDMGVMSGLIATNSKDLAALRELGERNYFEFDITKAQSQKKVGSLTLALKKSDPKRNRYTVEIMADDKRVEKKDKTINEPVQLYVSNNRQPYEVVVNQIKKDEVIGYLATPKVTMARQ